MKKSKQLVLALGLLVLLPLGGLVVFNLFSKPPHDLGAEDGRLTDCPASPNCVCSQASDESHRMPPLSFEGNAADAQERLTKAIQSIPRSKIVVQTGGYIRVEFSTAILRFVDDAEFLIDPLEGQIHFRSASRIGYSDLGANRRRMASIRAAFESM